MPPPSPPSVGLPVAIVLALIVVTLGMFMLGERAVDADLALDARMRAFEVSRQRFETSFRAAADSDSAGRAETVRAAWRDIADRARDLSDHLGTATVAGLVGEIDDLLTAAPQGVVPPGSVEGVHATLESIAAALRGAWSAERERTLRRHRALTVLAFALLLIEAAILAVPSLKRVRQAETAAQRAGAEIAYLAHHDDLTGLANRRGLEEHLAELTSSAAGSFGLILIDLDGFKPLNDVYGHAAGDEVLKAVAQRLKRDLRPGDVAARLGGDEFVLVVAGATDAPLVAAIADRLKRRLADPVRYGSHELRFRASLGTALFPEDGSLPHALLSAADAAMYEAKQSGGMAVRSYNAKLRDRDARRQQIVRELEHALARDGLTLVFQPQVELATGRVVGLEALTRWPSQRRGDVPPELFIPLAEGAGLLTPLTHWLLDETERCVMGWTAARVPPVRVSVNLSANGLVREDVFGALVDLNARLRRNRSRIGIEISEDAMFGRNADAVLAHLRQLHDEGVAIAIDGFGTGYASLSHLGRIPFDRLKIAGAFVHRLDDDAHAKAVVQTIIELARRMGRAAVATSVERRTQLDFLRRHACDEAQGYLFARPMPAPQTAAFLAELASGEQAGSILARIAPDEAAT